MIKRLVSMILCIFALCQMVCVYSYAFDWPWAQIKSQQSSANKKNKCGNFEDIEYLKNQCLKKLKNGKGFCRQLNIGPQCQTDLWFWDYVQIKEALPNLRKCSLNMESTIVDEIILNVADTIKSLFKTDFQMAKEISKYWLSKSLVINHIVPLIKKISKPNFQTEVTHNCSAKNRLEDFMSCVDHFIKVRSYSRAFDEILSGIMYKGWEQGDAVSLKINHNPGKDYGEHIDFVKQNIYYDENTKEAYERMFRELEETLINIANGNVC